MHFPYSLKNHTTEKANLNISKYFAKFFFTLVNPASHKGRNEQTFCPRPHGYGWCQQRLKPWFIVVCRSRSCGTLVGEFCVQALEKSWKERGVSRSNFNAAVLQQNSWGTIRTQQRKAAHLALFSSQITPVHGMGIKERDFRNSSFNRESVWKKK